MNFDFENIFHPKVDSQIIPKEWVEELNQELPDNMYYAYDDHTDTLYASRQDGADFKIEGLRFALTEEQRSIIGSKASLDDILIYMENSQEPIEIIPSSDDGTVLINGKRIPFNRLTIHMPKEFLLKENNKKVYAVRKVNQSISIHISNSKYDQEIKLKRVPHKSIKEMCLESDENAALKLRLVTDVKPNHNSRIVVTTKLKPSKASSVKELVEAISIYNSFVDPSLNDGLIDGVPSKIIDENNAKTFDPYTEWFWNKVLEIESYLGLSFSIPKKEIDDEIVKIVDYLYYCLVKKIPIRENYKIDSLDGDWSEAEAKHFIETFSGDSFAAFFSADETEIELFSQNFTIIKGQAGFDLQFSSFVVDTGKSKLLVDNKRNNSYVVVLWFKDQKEYYQFQENNDVLAYMQNAESIEVLIQRE